MEQYSRRRLLGAGVAALGGGLAGCVGGGSDGANEAGTATTGDGGLGLETLDAGGSSAGTVRVVLPGKTVLVDFFATWCAPCEPQMDHLRTVREQFPGIHMLSISWEEDREAIREFWQEHDGTWPVAVDPSAQSAERFGVSALPTAVVFAPDGTETWRHVGLVDAETLAARVEEAGQA
ncbi:TlpA family protein disulfide reductase [Halobacteriales archaeon QS_1_68_17]|jgi:thiol-disulfide isomerase/thioredoxin|nr:MAG: TlpA family protein disulfide reductase [Halobacteriales archaeon QS_1_68_17]